MEFRTEKKSICLKSSLGKQTVEGEKELNRVENKKKNILLAIIMCSLVVFLVKISVLAPKQPLVQIKKLQ